VREGTKERKGNTNSDYIQVPSNSQVKLNFAVKSASGKSAADRTDLIYMTEMQDIVITNGKGKVNLLTPNVNYSCFKIITNKMTLLDYPLFQG